MKSIAEPQPLGRRALVIAGQSPEGKFYNGSGQGLPFYQGKKDFGERELQAPTTWTTQTTKEAQAGDILMSVRAPVGPINFARDRVCIGRGLAAIRCRDGLDPDFLFYQLLGMQAEISGSEGAVFASINKAQIEALPIVVPPLPEQRRVVAILDEAFECIATAKANAQKNLQSARELGDLLRSGVFLRLADANKRHRLGDLCTFVRGPFGGSLKKDSFVEDGYAVYEQSHAIYDQFSEVRYFVDEAKFGEMGRFELRPNDLIMSCSGTMGRVAIAPLDLRRGIINQALLKLTPGISVEALYLKYWMESRDFQDALAQCSGGAAIQNVASVSVLKQIALPLPSVAAQRLAVDQLERFTAEAHRLHASYEQKVGALDELEKSLLHEAFTGAL